MCCAAKAPTRRCSRPPSRYHRRSATEGIRARRHGRASNPVGGVRRSQVGSTPAAFRRFVFFCRPRRRGVRAAGLRWRSGAFAPDFPVLILVRLRLPSDSAGHHLNGPQHEPRATTGSFSGCSGGRRDGRRVNAGPSAGMPPVQVSDTPTRCPSQYGAAPGCLTPGMMHRYPLNCAACASPPRRSRATSSPARPDAKTGSRRRGRRGSWQAARRHPTSSTRRCCGRAGPCR